MNSISSFEMHIQTADSLQTKTSLCLVADGQLESVLSQLLYAKRALSPIRLVLKVILFLLLHCTAVFLCIWGVLSNIR